MPPAYCLSKFGEIERIYLCLIEYEFVMIRFFIWSSVLSIVLEVTLLARKGPTTCYTYLKWLARTSSMSFSCSAWAFMALKDALAGFPASPGS